MATENIFPTTTPDPLKPTPSAFSLGAPQTGGLDQRAIDADPAGFAKWQAGKAKFDSQRPAPSAFSPAAITTTPFNEQNGTAAGRVNSIVSADGPLMQLAATRAKQQQNANGTLNSSMAIGAAQNAVIGAATPLATNDSQLFNANAAENQRALNQGSLFNASQSQQDKQFSSDLALKGRSLSQNQDQFTSSQAQQQNQFSSDLGLKAKTIDQQNAQFGQTLTQQDKQINQQNTQFTAKQAQDDTLARLDNTTRNAIYKLTEDNKKAIQGDLNISNAWQNLMQGIASIQNNPNLDGTTKATLIQNNMDSFKAYGSLMKVDLSKFGFGIDSGTGGPGVTTGAPSFGSGNSIYDNGNMP